MKDSRQAFERQLDRQLKRISGEIEKVLQAAEKVDPSAARELAGVIDQLCERWTDAERERNRMRVSAGEAWMLLRRDAEAALRGLRISLVRAACLTRDSLANGTAGSETVKSKTPGETVLEYRMAASGGSG